MRRLLLLALAAAVPVSSAGAVTVALTFDRANAPGATMACTGVDGGATDRFCTASNQFIGADYGSTTGLTVSYDPSEASGQRLSLRTSGSAANGAATNGGYGPQPAVIYFTPASGYEVSFTSFRWFKNSATSSSLFAFEVRDPANVLLWSGNNSAASYTVNTAYYTGPLAFLFTTNGRGSLSIDDVNVDVRTVGNPTPPPVNGVPEPGSWAMMITGFALVGAMRRRGVRMAAA